MPLAPPAILFEGRLWSADEMGALVASRCAELAPELERRPRLVAMPMVNHPEAVALLLALSCLPSPVVLLPADLRGWQSTPPIPSGTPLFLPRAVAHLGERAEELGLRPRFLAEPASPGGPLGAPLMSCPGFVFFTSGSTGLPRPVYRTSAQLIDAGLAPVSAVDVPPRGGFIASLPLDRTFGMHHGLMAAMTLGRRVALLPRFAHHAVLDLFATGDYPYWAATPTMADVLGRCRLGDAAPSPHPAPAFCVISGRLSASVCEAFRARFGVPLRQLYGTTETGPVTMDAAAAPLVRSLSAGRPLPGVVVRIGDDPRHPLPAGAVGRVWISSPGCSPGYGFPPDLEPLPGADGWWATPDVGEIDGDGRLVIAGRLDDCVRTATGHLVNTTVVAAALEDFPGLAEAVVVPVGRPGEPTLAALVEAEMPLDMDGVRQHLAARLPAVSMPKLIERVRALPRLSSGKPDRRACIAWLERPA